MTRKEAKAQCKQKLTEDEMYATSHRQLNKRSDLENVPKSMLYLHSLNNQSCELLKYHQK